MAYGKNIVVLGRGKLAQAIKRAADPSYTVTLLGRLNESFKDAAEYRLSALRTADVIVAAVPGTSMEAVMPMIMDAHRPAIIAGTGYRWPDNLDQTLHDRELTWVHSHNFAPDMQPIRHRLQAYKQAWAGKDIRPKIVLTETHDKSKLDKPSGTALMWREWLGRNFRIYARREEGAMPTHDLRITFMGGREDHVYHKAVDRQIYAEGILWTALQIGADHVPQKGLVSFEDLWDAQHPQILEGTPSLRA